MLLDMPGIVLVSVPPAVSLVLGVVGAWAVERCPRQLQDTLPARSLAAELGGPLVQADYYLARVGVSAACVSTGLYVAIWLRRDLFPASLILHGPWFYWVSWGVGSLALCVLLGYLLCKAVSTRRRVKRRFAVACVHRLLLGCCPQPTCDGSPADQCEVVSALDLTCDGVRSQRCAEAKGLQSEVDRFLAETGTWFGSYSRDAGYVAAGMIGFLWALLAASLVTRQ